MICNEPCMQDCCYIRILHAGVFYCTTLTGTECTSLAQACMCGLVLDLKWDGSPRTNTAYSDNSKEHQVFTAVPEAISHTFLPHTVHSIHMHDILLHIL